MNIFIEKVLLKHFVSILEISDSELGNGYITSKDIESYSHSFVMLINDQVIGFVLSDYLNSNQLTDFEDFVLIKQNKDFNNVYIIKTLVITPTYQRLGYGSMLINEVIKSVQKGTNIIVPAWRYDNNTIVEKLLLTFGFTFISTKKRFWYNDSIRRGYTCSVCGNPPCKCSADIYSLEII